MRKIPAAVLVLAILLTGCEEPAPRFEAPLASGVVTLPLLDTQRFDAMMSAAGLVAAFQGSGTAVAVHAPGAGNSLVVAHVMRSRFEPVILGANTIALDALMDGGYTLVVGSGFVSVFDPVSPLGLLQLDGEVQSELTPHGYTRILGVGDGELSIIGRRDYHPGLFESAIQVGPGVVERGKLDIRPQERELPPYIRAFVATCDDRWLAGIAQAPMHLYDVGESLVTYFASNSLACDEVVNLSGDREALLALISDDRESIAYFGNPTLPKASVVAFRARRAQPN
ncbi:MAG: hypothetical protein F4029_08255 [Gammaproteobacteria bacterium]|nr:hypothetical protein [Gammaproteobacteria bacterium]MXY56888.1 hypothetical protein [Gammaproteobacteria bacterium]MYF29243.1 hypothetical protein [Gammaproteobacteria bacterium]MYK46206.1 hypothetical protein [Gammaproteobacteria bacterium]